MQKLIDWLKSLDPKKRKQLILAAILVGLLFGVLLSNNAAPQAPEAVPCEIDR